MLLFLFAPTASAAEQTVETPSVDTCTRILVDHASGKVLTGDNTDEKLDPTSLAKIMASYVVGQAFKTDKIKLTDMVTVGRDAWATGNLALRGSSVMFPKPGDRVSMAGLNKGVVIQSGNDACIALADYIVGNQESFIGSISGYAKKLGLTSITFQAVHGLDTPRRFSTIRDMTLLSKALIHDVPEEYAIHKRKEFTLDKVHQPNRDRLLWSSNLSIDGMKTGITAGAGYNLIVSAARGDMHLVSVMPGTKTGRIRFSRSEKLLALGFRFSKVVTLIKPDATFVTQRVWFGDKSEMNLGAGEAGSVIIPRGQLRNLKASYTLTESQLTALLKKGQVVGTINFQLNGESIERRPLIVMENVEEGGFFGRMWDFMMMRFYQWFGSWFF